MKTNSNIIHFILCLVYLFVFTSCESKQTPINQLKDLVEDIQKNASEYTDDDWYASAEELELIDRKIELYQSEYTNEELIEIGRLKGVYTAQLAKHSIKALKKDVNDTMKEAEGFIEGLMDELSN